MNERYSLDDRRVVQGVIFDGVTALTDYEVVNRLNEQEDTIQRQSRIIQRQEMALSNMNNSRYKCSFCGAVGFLTETFQRLIE